MNKSENSKPDRSDVQKAEELLSKVEQDNINKCSEIIYAALQEFDCFLQPEFFYRGGQWRDRVLVRPRQKNTPPMIRTQIPEEEISEE